MKTGLQIVYSPGSQENYMASGNYKKQTWDEWYGCAKAYYEEKGNLLVPGRYKTMDGYSLGRWIERQRARYNGLHDNMIHTDEVIALEKIGMVWKLENRLSWEQWIYMAENYYLQYGNLEVHTAFTVDGYRLGYWVREQRKKRKAGKLTKNRYRTWNTAAWSGAVIKEMTGFTGIHWQRNITGYMAVYWFH